MLDTNSPNTPRQAGRRRLIRMVAACGITLSALATAAPSWAGPLMGC
jgi:hypothetical protein